MGYQKCSDGLTGIQKITPRKQLLFCSYLYCTSGMTVGLTTVPIVTKGRAEVESIRLTIGGRNEIKIRKSL